MAKLAKLINLWNFLKFSYKMKFQSRSKKNLILSPVVQAVQESKYSTVPLNMVQLVGLYNMQP